MLWVEADVVGWEKSDFCWDRLLYGVRCCIRRRAWCGGDIGCCTQEKKSSGWNGVRRVCYWNGERVFLGEKKRYCRNWVTARIMLPSGAVKEGWGLAVLVFVAFAKRQKLLTSRILKRLRGACSMLWKKYHAARAAAISPSRRNFCTTLEENN